MFKLICLILLTIFVGLSIIVINSQASQKWSVGEIVRTPNHHFESLTDYPFSANYVESLGYRIHYIDEGPADGQVVLLMHGQPSWSYLYRHMIPELVEAGFRVIAPDNVGFGKSDKPLKTSDHNYQMHIDVMANFVDLLDLKDVTFFGQDWGGLIGLRVIAEKPERFARIMLSNTGLPAASGIRGWLGFPLFKLAVWKEGKVQALDMDSDNFSFAKWVAYARHADDFNIQELFQRATNRVLDDASLNGYAAPFPEEKYMAAVRIFPALVPSQLRQNQRIMDDFYGSWDKPLITAFGSDDRVTAGRDKVWQSNIPGARNQAHKIITDANHFIQDDKPLEVSAALIEFINRN